MGAALAAMDWSATPLGPVQQWPQSLRTTVSLCLSSRAPMMIVWGPQHVQLYNDALAPLMGPKHPAALGRPYRESFSEIWDETMGPMLAAVYDRAESSYLEDLPVSFHRRVPDEEMFWTFSWSPLRDEDGEVAGALHPAVETTGRVLAERRLRLLRDLASSASQSAQLQEACDRAVAVLGEYSVETPLCAIYLVEDVPAQGVPSTARRVAQSGVLPSSDVFPRELDLTSSTYTLWPLAEAAASRRMQIVDHLQLQVPELTSWPWPTSSTAALVLPLVQPGSVVPMALLALALNPRRPVDDEQLDFLQLLAAQLATSLATAALHEQQYTVALALQRSMLPDTVARSSTSTLEVAARYFPGAVDVEVGGDWYDVIALGAGRTALVIGDVMGRGVHAAAVMGQLRAAVRAYSQLDLPPHRVLDLLGRMVEHLSEDRDIGQIVTCVYAVHDAGDAELTLASAGHPPALLFDGRACDEVQVPVGPPLGTGEHGYQTVTVPFRPGAGLLLYTDGLIERRDSDIDVGIRRLRDVVRATGADDLERLADRVMAMHDGAQDDDVAVLAVRVPHTDIPLPFQLDLRSDPRAARSARRATTQVLSEWSLRLEVVDTAALLVTELVNNAITHAGRPQHVRLRLLTDRLVIEVGDTDPRPPQPLVGNPGDEGGRGLLILAALASDWGVRTLGSGKIVWCELPR
jgi:serine phosphatase RsbU (regulator of sigma subunit)/anti-sigma regulatory factor (Ser/Thr protein kinase)